MCGMEFFQPAIVAQALAQACVHDTGVGEFLLTAEKMADEAATSTSARMPSILSLYEAVRADEELADAVCLEDDNKVLDGVLVRARAEMLDVASQVRVPP